jgi:hypothetical protein
VRIDGQKLEPKEKSKKWGGTGAAFKLTKGLHRVEVLQTAPGSGSYEGFKEGLMYLTWQPPNEPVKNMEARSIRAAEVARSGSCSLSAVESREGAPVAAAKVSPKGAATTLKNTVCPYGPIDDIQAAILYVRSQPLTAGQVITRVIQPFDRPYLATFTVMARETRTVAGTDYPTIRLDVKIRKLHATKLELSSYKKMKTATIWVSDDAWRVPVEMHASIWVGFVSATLTKREYLTGKDALGKLPPSMMVK